MQPIVQPRVGGLMNIIRVCSISHAFICSGLFLWVYTGCLLSLVVIGVA